MKHATATRIVLMLLLIVGIIGFSAFGQKEDSQKATFRKERSNRDEDSTSRSRRAGNMDNKDVDRELNEALKNLDAEMKKLDEKLARTDFDKMSKELEASMKKVDFEKVGKEMEAALKNIDVNKLTRDAEEAISKVDCEKMKKEMHAAMEKLHEVDMPKMRQHLQQAQAEMQKSREHMQLDHEKMKINIEKSMQGARETMAKAKDEIMLMKTFTDELQHDGLIDKSKGYRVEVKGGELYLNGKKQTKEVSDKYRKYYKKDNFQISTQDDSDRI